MANQVSVSNELDDAVNRQGFDTKLLPLDRDDDPVELPYSPPGHERAASPNWSTRGAVGATVDPLDWENSDPDQITIAVTLQSDIGGVGEFTPAELFELLRTLEEWATQPTKRTGEPTRVVLEQGAGSMSGVLDEVSTNVIEKTSDGLPRTAELSFTVREK